MSFKYSKIYLLEETTFGVVEVLKAFRTIECAIKFKKKYEKNNPNLTYYIDEITFVEEVEE